MPRGQLVLGIDTHKNAHVAAVLDDAGRLCGLLEFAATDAGARRLLAWVRQYGRPVTAGVEGTGSYGYQLARQLQAAGITVLEVNRPDRSRRRRKGKSDPVDAEAAARAVIAGDAAAVPKNREGPVGALRALSMARSSAVKGKTQASNQIRALLVGCPEMLRHQLTSSRGRDEAIACSRLHATSGIKAALRSLGRRWQLLDTEITDLDGRIKALVVMAAPALLGRPGIGIHCAAQLLVTAGDNPTRLTSDAAFAALCGVSPVEASSGQTIRHRLNRGGDRQANNALWTIAHVRLVHDQRTRDYAAKRQARGDNRKEILRMLKRYIAREVFAIIIAGIGAPSRDCHLT